MAVAIAEVEIDQDQFKKIIEKGEGHFSDLKSAAISPAKLTQSMSAFANADGGELFVGIDEARHGRFRWIGFADVEAANGHIQAFEKFFPLGAYFSYEFLRLRGEKGLVLHCEIDKTPDVRSSSGGDVYVRRGAQNLKQQSGAEIDRIKLNKGIYSFEDHILNAEESEISNSATIIGFMIEVVPLSEPEVCFESRSYLKRASQLSAVSCCSQMNRRRRCRNQQSRFIGTNRLTRSEHGRLLRLILCL